MENHCPLLQQGGQAGAAQPVHTGHCLPTFLLPFREPTAVTSPAAQGLRPGGLPHPFQPYQLEGQRAPPGNFLVSTPRGGGGQGGDLELWPQGGRRSRWGSPSGLGNLLNFSGPHAICLPWKRPFLSPAEGLLVPVPASPGTFTHLDIHRWGSQGTEESRKVPAGGPASPSQGSHPAFPDFSLPVDLQTDLTSRAESSGQR